MPQIKATLPNGKSVVLHVPEGATDDTIQQSIAMASEPEPMTAHDIDKGDLGERFRAGAGMRVDQLLDELTKVYLSTKGDNKALAGLQQNVEAKAPINKIIKDTGAGSAGSTFTDAAITTIPAGKAASGAVGLVKSTAPALAKTMAGLAGAGAAGAGFGAIEPTTENESRAGNMAFGFGSGVLGQGVGNVIGKGIEGIVKVAPAAKKLAKDVYDQATLGQIADKTTTMGRVVSRGEEAMKSLPILGSMIAKARERGTNAWRNDVLGRTFPDNFKLPPVENTREAVGKIGDEFSDRYAQALAGHNNILPSQPFESRVASVIRNPQSGLPQPQQQELTNLVMNYYNNMFAPKGLNSAPSITAKQAKEFEAFLTAFANNYGKSNHPQAGAMANALRDIEHGWTVAYRSQLPTATRAAIKPIDQKYAPFKTVERAAASVGNDGGDFTPSQLLKSVKDRSTLPKFARQEGLLQEEAQAGKAVFGDKLPDSGTSERALWGGLGLGLLTEPTATTAATVGAIPLMTTAGGKNLMTGDTALQMMLKKLRAGEIARGAGAGVGIGSGAYLTDQGSY